MGDNSYAFIGLHLFDKKFTISLDIFNYKDGDYFKDFSEKIIYIKKLDTLKEINFDKINRNFNKKQEKSISQIL